MQSMHARRGDWLLFYLFIYLPYLFFQPTLRHLLDLKTIFEDATCCWITGKKIIFSLSLQTVIGK